MSHRNEGNEYFSGFYEKPPLWLGAQDISPPRPSESRIEGIRPFDAVLSLKAKLWKQHKCPLGRVWLYWTTTHDLKD